MEPEFHINQRLSFTPGQAYTAARCTVRYSGPVDGTTGTWLGVEWDVEGKGKHSGVHGGKEYFKCKAPGNASFIRTTRRPDDTLSFLEGLRRKYTTADDPPDAHAVLSLTANKVFEEVGFEKIQKKLGQLKELKIVILDGLCLARADAAGEIAETCPKIEELDLSRNLFEDLQTVASICAALPHLRSLKISGNRFSSLEVERVPGQPSPFEGVTSLEISNTYLTWDETTQILTHFPNIQTLESSLNRISTIPANISLPPTITTLNLERNTFTSLTAVLPLTSLPALSRLILAHNLITAILDPASETTPPTQAFKTLTHLDLTYNHLPTFPHLDALPQLFPQLTSIRLSHNPFYSLLPREEAHMLTLARLPEHVSMLNHTRVLPAERQNAEMYYLGRIAKELAAVGETEEEEVLRRHGRWGVLCELYGAPRIDRATALEKRCLGARLVKVEFVNGEKKVVRGVPRGMAVSTVRALVARWFGVEPLGVGLWLLVDGEEGGEGARVALEDGVRELGYYVEGKEGTVLVGA
ncbi:uncharacterized protein H6S33_007512 [Morchella sextelata]|uniref:uncharacterized protein n=1 Tax=Morchella sextelata TaxID=1174677 RepID=UPI001D052DD3|nr:uncharacterized protein H6S33_007512 [Morchella sextelata]KAH0603853.1 hypothetical protein H6S33_007512 [Morchella sextelata]